MNFSFFVRGKALLAAQAFASGTEQHASAQNLNEENEFIALAMEQLSGEQRAILAFRFDEKMTVRQIADLLELPHTTVHAKLQRAIQTLRSKLGSTMEVD